MGPEPQPPTASSAARAEPDLNDVLLPLVLVHAGARVLRALKREMSSEHCVEHDTEGPDVGPLQRHKDRDGQGGRRGSLGDIP